MDALPVVDEQTQLLGIITTTDIMYATLRNGYGRTVTSNRR
jgi:CBS domain-containing protein